MKKKMLAVLSSAMLLLFVIILCVALMIQNMTAALLSSEGGGADYANTAGLPPYITQEMLIATLNEQEATGYPASVTIAQIIVESGNGRYGPGGETGHGLSQLAYEYKNLFGMKAPAGDNIPIGVINMSSGEQYGASEVMEVSGFLVFSTYTDCIKYRSGLLTRRYSDLIRNVTDADAFASQIAGRWATSTSYAASLKKFMQQYNLYRFDSMTAADLENTGWGGSDNGSLSAGQQTIRELALSRNSFGVGQGMCQAWVANVYNRAGQTPRQSRACATEAANAFLVSASRTDIPVGATVYGSHSNPTVMCGGHDAGHVGIYVGNGQVASMEAVVTVKPLEQWISGYGWRGWGWNGNQSFI